VPKDLCPATMCELGCAASSLLLYPLLASSDAHKTLAKEQAAIDKIVKSKQNAIDKQEKHTENANEKYDKKEANLKSEIKDAKDKDDAEKLKQKADELKQENKESNKESSDTIKSLKADQHQAMQGETASSLPALVYGLVCALAVAGFIPFVPRRSKRSDICSQQIPLVDATSRNGDMQTDSPKVRRATPYGTLQQIVSPVHGTEGIPDDNGIFGL